MIFKRKIYKKLLAWKQEAKGSKALLIEGARRIGKSTIVEEFARNEYKSYILIDFNDASQNVIQAFENYLTDLDTFFLLLSTEYNIQLHNRESLLIFDEIQRYPKARQSIKALVKDGRFDYIETGSLISVKESVKDITIPSEERKLKMYPMDFEEFCLALGEKQLLSYIRLCFDKRQPLAEGLHHKAMLLFRQFLIVGGMPKSVDAYVKGGKSFADADVEKRDILNLYRDDIMKIDAKYRSRVLSVFDQIPSFLSKHEKRVVLANLERNATFEKYDESFFWLADSMIANECFNCNDPNVGLSLNEDRTYIKCYMSDTGLLTSHTFDEKAIIDEELYKHLLLGKLSINEGMLFENAVLQELVALGHKPYFYTHYSKEKGRNDIEIDFLISNKSKTRFKVLPIEVKASDRYSTKSLERFLERFKDKVGQAYVIHPKNLKATEKILYLPAYMVMCLA